MPPTVRADAPRRRPTGAPPPLPRKLGASGRFWLVLAVLFGTALVLLFPNGQPQIAVDFEAWILRSIAELRADWLTPTMRALSAIGTGWIATILGGRPRQWAKWAIAVVVSIVAFARLYMGVDHPAEITHGVVLTVAVMLVAFRWFAPNEAFPVTYRRGNGTCRPSSGGWRPSVGRSVSSGGALRRIGLALGSVALLAAALLFVGQVLSPVQDLDVVASPTCKAQSVTVLMAQAVPLATAVPCISSLPAGLSFGGATVHNGLVRFWLDSDLAGAKAVTVTLTRTCDTSTASTVPTDEPAADRLDNRDARSGEGSRVDRFNRFPGGCVSYDFSFPSRNVAEVSADAETALGFFPRDRLVEYVEAQDNLTLRGAGTTCPG